jgi:hypothetical protein
MQFYSVSQKNKELRSLPKRRSQKRNNSLDSGRSSRSWMCRTICWRPSVLAECIREATLPLKCMIGVSNQRSDGIMNSEILLLRIRTDTKHNSNFSHSPYGQISSFPSGHHIWQDSLACAQSSPQNDENLGSSSGQSAGVVAPSIDNGMDIVCVFCSVDGSCSGGIS